MVKHAHADPAGYTLEIGPGTGVVTQALIDAGIPAGADRQRRIRQGFLQALAKALSRHARDPRRCARSSHNARRIPRHEILRGDFRHSAPEPAEGEARALSGKRPRPARPRRRRLAALLFFVPPQEAIPGRLAVDKSKWVTFNFPPGRAWIYRGPRASRVVSPRDRWLALRLLFECIDILPPADQKCVGDERNGAGST